MSPQDYENIKFVGHGAFGEVRRLADNEFLAWYDKTGQGSFISPDEFEREIAALFPPPLIQDGKLATRKPLEDSVFQQTIRLLELSGKHDWSLRPRTYAVLYMINEVDAMDSFVEEELYDISFPYLDKTLPHVFESPCVRSQFLELQCLVFAADIEDSRGRHSHFAQDGDMHFRVIRKLGTGGFGEVHHVQSKLSRNEFARKRIPRKKYKGKGALLGFERELSTLKRLSHRHLVDFVGSYTDPKYVGLIMLPVADSDLEKFLQIDPFPTERRPCLQRFYGCLTSALLYLHEEKVRHKDIKPGNILVHGENILLTDFGTALDWTDNGKSTTFERPDAISVLYCSPEVAAWEPRNSSSDIYSLGCVFMEMTTVLKGESLDKMKTFFKEHGTEKTCIRTNREATQLWFARLQSKPGPGYNNEPFIWIKSMVKVEPDGRPGALELLKRIRSSKGDFCGTCCANDDESTNSPYQGSMFDEEATRVIGNTDNNLDRVILLNAALSAQISTFSPVEVELRNRLKIYEEKFKQVEDTLNSSNDLFLMFRKEMEGMSTKTKRLEKENIQLTRKHDLTNRNILEMAEELTKSKNQIEQLRRMNGKLENLCRALQQEKRGYEPK